jgi:shikimate 5-dehydrogenase
MLSKLSRERYDVLINCTPANATLPDAAIKGRLVYDVIYRPQATALLKRAQERGIPTLGGLEMLVRQAADQYVMFTGRDAPLDAMRDAARMELERAEESG